MMINKIITNKAWKTFIKDISKNSNIINITDFLTNDNIAKFELNFLANLLDFDL